MAEMNEEQFLARKAFRRRRHLGIIGNSQDEKDVRRDRQGRSRSRINAGDRKGKGEKPPKPNSRD